MTINKVDVAQIIQETVEETVKDLQTVAEIANLVASTALDVVEMFVRLDEDVEFESSRDLNVSPLAFDVYRRVKEQQQKRT